MNLESFTVKDEGKSFFNIEFAGMARYLAILCGPIVFCRPVMEHMRVSGNQFFALAIWLIMFFLPHLSKASKYYKMTGK